MKNLHTLKRTAQVKLGGAQLQVSYEIEGDCFYDPGKMSGPPEHCYPPEAEVTRMSLRDVIVRDSIGKLIQHPPTLELVMKELRTLPNDDYLLENWLAGNPTDARDED